MTPPRPADLTPVEIHMLARIAGGASADAVARELDTTPHALRLAQRDLCARLGVAAPVEVAAWAARHDLIATHPRVSGPACGTGSPRTAPGTLRRTGRRARTRTARRRPGR